MKIKNIIISIFGGLFDTGFIYSFFYFFVTGNITYLFYFGIPVFTWLIGGAIYMSLKDSDIK